MTRRSKSRCLRSFVAAACVAAALGLPAPAEGGEPRQSPGPLPYTDLPNGDFADGLSGWILDRRKGGYGHGSQLAQADLVASPEGHLRLRASVFLDQKPSRDGSGGQAQVSARQTIRVSHRFLEFRILGGGYGCCWWGDTSASLECKLVITASSGERSEHSIFETGTLPQSCAVGTCYTGILAAETVSIDLFEAGFPLGQTVTIHLIWSASMFSLDPCEWGDIGGSIRVDDFRLCDGASSSATTDVVQRRAGSSGQASAARVAPPERLGARAGELGVRLDLPLLE